MNSREILIYLFCIKYKFNWDKTFEAIVNKECFDPEDKKIQRQIKRFRATHVCITILDEDYPDRIKHAVKPAFVIVNKGCDYEYYD